MTTETERPAYRWMKDGYGDLFLNLTGSDGHLYTLEVVKDDRVSDSERVFWVGSIGRTGSPHSKWQEFETQREAKVWAESQVPA